VFFWSFSFRVFPYKIQGFPLVVKFRVYPDKKEIAAPYLCDVKIKKMSWSQIEKKHREKYHRDFVLCREADERKFLVDAILETFNFIKREEVEKTFDHFCESCVQPPARVLFLSRIKEQLGKEITERYLKKYIFY